MDDRYVKSCSTSLTISSVQFSCSVVSDSLRPHESQHARPPCPSPSPGLTLTHAHRVSDAIQPSHPLSSPSPPAPNPSQHQSLFQRLRMRWPKYWSFSFSIIPSKEIPGLQSAYEDWEVQTLASSPCHHLDHRLIAAQARLGCGLSLDLPK